MLNYFIRTTGERVLDDSLSQIEYTTLVDKEHKPVESFINQLEYISSWDSVLIEDDVVLCKGFKEKIEEVISNYPDKIINFFTFPTSYFTTHITFYDFRYNQCTYYPKGVAKLIAQEMRQLRKRYPKEEYDVLESFALRNLQLVYLLYRPCLVQHKDTSTLIHTQHFVRATPYFIDYLDKLGINYEDAYKKENKEKLEALMRAHLLSK